MPRTTQTIRVLISSPLDLKRDRRVAVNVVEEVNRLLSEFHGVQLEAWTCESRVPSGLGSDAQAHVTRELGEYDFYVGMMWTRFGRPTPRAGSGTAEEFNDAIARRRADASSMEVMFYFCVRKPDSSKVDAEQLRGCPAGC